jgi:hypothetical protein
LNFTTRVFWSEASVEQKQAKRQREQKDPHELEQVADSDPECDKQSHQAQDVEQE